MQRNLETILKYTEPVGDCLEWVRCYNFDGYPRANIDGNVNIKVHRVVWELHNNDSAQGLVVRHTCDNPKCINPKHLVIGTAQDNVKDRDTRNRTHRKITPKIINAVKVLLRNKELKQKDIATLLNIDVRRVSDINCDLYSDDGKFTHRQKP